MRPANWRDPLLDLSVIGPAFQLLFRRWQEYLLLGFLSLILAVIFAIPGYVLLFTSMLNSREPDFNQILLMYPVLYGGLFVGVALSYPINFGIVNFTLREVMYGDATLADAWAPLKNYFRYMGAGVVIVVATFVASICGCIVGGLIVSGLFLFVAPIMLHEGLGVFDAMKESWDRCKPQMFMAIAVVFVSQLLSTLGQAACGVGLFLTLPLVYIIPTMLYANGFAQFGASQASHSPYPRGTQGGQEFGSTPQPPQQPTSPPPRPEDFK